MRRRTLYLLVLLVGVALATAAPLTHAAQERQRAAAYFAARLAGPVGIASLAALKHAYNSLSDDPAPKTHFKEYLLRWQDWPNDRPRKPAGRHPTLDRETVYKVATVYTQETIGRGEDARPYLNMEEVSWWGGATRHVSTPHGCRCCAPKA